MKLLISLLLLVTAVLTLAAERRTVVVVRELPPPAAAPVPTAADGERWSGFDAGPGPLPRGCSYETLAEVAVSDSAAAEAVAPFPAEVMAWPIWYCWKRVMSPITPMLVRVSSACSTSSGSEMLTMLRIGMSRPYSSSTRSATAARSFSDIAW